MKSGNDALVLSGLRALYQIVNAYESENEELRQEIEQASNYFYPILDAILDGGAYQSSPSGIDIMYLMCKIYRSTALVICLY